MDKTIIGSIIVAIIGALGLIIAHNLPYIREHFGERIKQIFIVCIISSIIVVGYIKYQTNKSKVDKNTEILTVSGMHVESENNDKEVDKSLEHEKGNEELNKLLEYEPEIKNISEEEFNLANRYYVQMITVETESKAKDLTEAVKGIFPQTRYEQTQSGKYKIILEEGEGKSIEDLSIMKVNYNKKANNILKDNKKGSCDIWIPVYNKYIKNEIEYIEYLVDIIEEQPNIEMKKKCEDRISIIKYSIDKYLDQPLFNMYKEELNKIIEDIQ